MTLQDLDDLLNSLARASEGLPLEEFKRLIIPAMQRNHPGEKLYIQTPDTSKKAQVIEAARTLPSGIVAERCGVSRQYVNRLIRRK